MFEAELRESNEPGTTLADTGCSTLMGVSHRFPLFGFKISLPGQMNSDEQDSSFNPLASLTDSPYFSPQLGDNIGLLDYIRLKLRQEYLDNLNNVKRSGKSRNKKGVCRSRFVYNPVAGECQPTLMGR
ncbi:unnamed protein product [Owenia fusiformis]|uniref:Uncharacterized protein n=1 Tax=Owenia fusiformis TaxID=6347 RepID=A0A8S4P2D7_OWEFU|nr:unnamed protein product [Owenia fusiformis]